MCKSVGQGIVLGKCQLNAYGTEVVPVIVCCGGGIHVVVACAIEITSKYGICKLWSEQWCYLVVPDVFTFRCKATAVNTRHMHVGVREVDDTHT